MARTNISISMVFSLTLFIYAGSQDFIDIPCVDYHKVTKIHYRDSSGAVSKIEIKESDGRIIFHNTMTQRKNGKKFTIEMIDTAIEKNGTIFSKKTLVKNNGKLNVKSIYKPLRPLCGHVPKKYSYHTTSHFYNMGRRNMPVETLFDRVSIQKLDDNKTIKVPAGTFSPQVYKFIEKFVAKSQAYSSTSKFTLTSFKYYDSTVCLVMSKSFSKMRLYGKKNVSKSWMKLTSYSLKNAQ